ncbi:catechol 2,3-dioxygenase-like lactoylglutathione lyase family enzyme [Hoeflea halophila]|uniref:Catechol 2,3-dioxygenase-like lactoylglutathione lyase family enzyme n=1 Tax=Hoeflea halophila TaxID=714899 RepID=A0A286I3P6_9HYPH|nr:VOC family protein [Hoeflea halophila]SOE14597.1 catechol 2,3-dioxygenase-like lactoylglutathione lyase family enzyme [Hoeflea halophila]
MAQSQLEHVNFTVADADSTARWLCDVFGWTIRWQGPALNGGHTIHVGTEDAYLAIYTPKDMRARGVVEKYRVGSLNHVGVVVDDLDAVEAQIKELGYEPYNHADYEPGRRFYFDDENGIEFEVVSYG